MSKVTPFLWFDGQAEEAAAFYVSLFPNSRITNVTRHGGAGPGPKGSAMTVSFELDGRPFIALNGGPHFKFNEAVSFSVSCEGQEEVDRYWSALTEGGEEGRCGGRPRLRMGPHRGDGADARRRLPARHAERPRPFRLGGGLRDGERAARPVRQEDRRGPVALLRGVGAERRRGLELPRAGSVGPPDLAPRRRRPARAAHLRQRHRKVPPRGGAGPLPRLQPEGTLRGAVPPCAVLPDRVERLGAPSRLAAPRRKVTERVSRRRRTPRVRASRAGRRGGGPCLDVGPSDPGAVPATARRRTAPAPGRRWPSTSPGRPPLRRRRSARSGPDRSSPAGS
jgi:uncharacterized glyoxalase superfamily protein PhnB